MIRNDAALHRADYAFFSFALLLTLFGLMMLSSAGSAIGQERFGDNYFFIKRQLLFGILPGIAFFFLCARISYHTLKRLSIPIGIASLLLLFLVFIPGIGSRHGTGSLSWLTIGSYSFQPAEAAKLGLILFFAVQLSRMGEKIRDWKSGLVPVLLWCLPFLAMVAFQPDLGTLLVLFAIVFGMLFVAEAKISHLAILGAAGLALFMLMALVAPYRVARLTTFLHPELDPQGVGYHINQAFLAIGSGGIFGLGFGHSRQKFQYLPEVHADSIFAIIAEEMGFLFAAGVVMLFLALARRGFRIAKNAPDQFGRFTVSGIMVWFLVQAFFNIGAMVGLVPLTGLPLPFISHGGTA
ncbi:MAG: putative peptidoglycan glycosyltransferase FtsW, partial [Patescibacteria group bacterium]